MEKFKNINEVIIEAVQVLNNHGFITCESCHGGEGHCFDLPTVRFQDNEFDLIRVYRICENYGIKIYQANKSIWNGRNRNRRYKSLPKRRSLERSF
ncbi:hypothetical protein AEQU1_00616 [Aequorivita sp. CIP111184]|nr:hypothetical protein AEQU1_00616 [Aequorivita sp. CIP111184]